ncbi:MAG TPA: hypothetical protein PKE06_22515 [Flavilitoribacter sp.]|nr:hypothetical protein [Flavilitoribacter sp.]HMQ89605.1 hypothetical protein [Flavilitoribacter sp.]
MIKSILLGGVLLLAAQCQKEAAGKTNFTNQEATIKMVVISRGVYQYFIQVNDPSPRLLSPDQPLEEAFKQDGLQVLFDGAQLPDSAWVEKPGPTDIPAKDFKVPKVTLASITKQ